MPNFYAPESLLSHDCDQGWLPYMKQYADICTSIGDYKFRYDSDGNPLIEDCQKHMFPQYYLSPEAMSLFERLYYNTSENSVQTAFIEFWKAVSNRFAGNPYAIGFDPINEPFPSNMYTNPSLVTVPGLFDEYTLQPFYNRIFNEAYRGNSEKLMFFEPAQFPDFYGTQGGIIFNLGFTEAPGGAEYSNLQVLNDHTYCCEVSVDMCANGEPPLSRMSECRSFHEKRVTTRKSDALRYNVPLFFSEFGACMGTESCIEEITAVTEVCDEHLVGWAYWQLKTFGDLTTTASTGSEGFYNHNGTL